MRQISFGAAIDIRVKNEPSSARTTKIVGVKYASYLRAACSVASAIGMTKIGASP